MNTPPIDAKPLHQDLAHIQVIADRFWGLPIVGTKTWNSLSLNEALPANRKKQFYEEYPFQKVVLAAFLSQFMQI